MVQMTRVQFLFSKRINLGRSLAPIGYNKIVGSARFSKEKNRIRPGLEEPGKSMHVEALAAIEMAVTSLCTCERSVSGNAGIGIRGQS